MTQQIIQHSSKSQEHYTPDFVLDAVRKTLGTIDLDPASSEIANKKVKAKHFYTKEDDGLSQPWHGKIFCNPPGGKVGNQSLNKLFWYKLIDEVLEERVSEAIFLAYSIELLQTSQSHPNKRYHVASYEICIPKKRIAYINQDGNPQKSPPNAGMIVYVNRDMYGSLKFEKCFNHIGSII